MNCLIIDDEPVAREVLREYIREVPDLNLAGECKNAIEALTFLKKHPVDLLFLDINMPKLTGLSFLKSLNDPPKVILTTAYSEYALEGYELNVVDYLLKPFSFERFLKALQKVQEARPVKPIDKSIVIKADGKMYRISESDILFLESLGDYIILHTRDQKLTFNHTLKAMLGDLSDAFIQVHKSYLVALDKIDYVEGNVIYLQGHEVPVGKAFKKEFQERFSE